MSITYELVKNCEMDDQDSEATVLSSNESLIESINDNDEDNCEVAKILGHKFQLPKELCENHDVFSELFSMTTWNQLSNHEKERLSEFLPKFPEDQKLEKQKTVERLFDNKISRFDKTPLDSFFNNLQDGNYRPDIAHYRSLILKSEERDQRIQECERVSNLAKKLVLSREKLLRSVYRRPSDKINSVNSSNETAEFSKLSSSMIRANRRYLHELKAISTKFNHDSSDEDDKEFQQINFSKKALNDQVKSLKNFFICITKFISFLAQ